MRSAARRSDVCFDATNVVVRTSCSRRRQNEYHATTSPQHQVAVDNEAVLLSLLSVAAAVRIEVLDLATIFHGSLSTLLSASYSHHVCTSADLNLCATCMLTAWQLLQATQQEACARVPSARDESTANDAGLPPFAGSAVGSQI
eukprot:6184910-Pleurochrysis_carterae.AAC.6